MKKLIVSILMLLASATLYAENYETDIEYSILYPSQEKFLSFIESLDINETTVAAIYADCTGSPTNAFICALAYDYGYNMANKDVDQYYGMAADADVNIGDKSARYEYADYMLRTKRPGNIGGYFSAGECYTRKSSGTCFYLIGMAEYLDSKKCKYLKLAARKDVKKGLTGRLCNGR